MKGDDKSSESKKGLNEGLDENETFFGCLTNLEKARHSKRKYPSKESVVRKFCTSTSQATDKECLNEPFLLFRDSVRS